MLLLSDLRNLCPRSQIFSFFYQKIYSFRFHIWICNLLWVNFAWDDQQLSLSAGILLGCRHSIAPKSSPFMGQPASSDWLMQGCKTWVPFFEGNPEGLGQLANGISSGHCCISASFLPLYVLLIRAISNKPSVAKSLRVCNPGTLTP